jgi:hypothetical protein
MEIEPEYRYTRHQVARGTLSDRETHNRIYLFKRVPELGATYQVRLLAYKAWKNGQKLVLRVPHRCVIRPSLRALRAAFPKLIEVERVDG